MRSILLHADHLQYRDHRNPSLVALVRSGPFVTYRAPLHSHLWLGGRILLRHLARERDGPGETQGDPECGRDAQFHRDEGVGGDHRSSRRCQAVPARAERPGGDVRIVRVRRTDRVRGWVHGVCGPAGCGGGDGEEDEFQGERG
jgi:hypothetical protein